MGKEFDAADAHFHHRIAEFRIIRGDDDVAGQGDLESAAHGQAIDGGNDGFLAVKALRQAGKAAVRAVGRISFSLPFQVIARGKCFFPGAGNDGDPEIGVVFEIIEDFIHLEMGMGMQGIHAFGSVHGHSKDMAVLFGQAIFRHFLCFPLRFFTFDLHPSLKYPPWPAEQSADAE